MNNRTQQRLDRSIRDAVAAVRRRADLDHAEQQAYAEDRERAQTVTTKPKRPAPARLSEADKLRAYGAGVCHPMIADGVARTTTLEAHK